MAIQSSTAINVPSVAADSLAVGVVIQPRFTPTGVTATFVLNAQRYRQPAGGAPVKIGDPVSLPVADVFAQAEKDPAFAALVTQMEGLIQSYVTSKGL